MTTAEHLRLAAYILDEWGWAPHAGLTGEATCALGAIVRAAGYELDGPDPIEEVLAAVETAHDALRHHVGFADIASWSDAAGKDEVVRALRTAAERAAVAS